ncbi:MAG: GNAT family N-acetyltransferase [Candidatus Thorarchaeota archaeon]
MVRLKDGREIELRLLTLDDRDHLLGFFSSLSDDALEWGMPPYTKERIDGWMSNFDRLIPLVAIDNERIVGYAAIFKRMHPRMIGVGGMGIYLHQDFHRVGLGTAITEKAISLAIEEGLHRIGLEVVEDNVAAVALYKKFGFRVEGSLIDAYYGADKRYHNMLVMGKILQDK